MKLDGEVQDDDKKFSEGKVGLDPAVAAWHTAANPAVVVSIARLHLSLGRILLETSRRWLGDQGPALAAALAYYTAFAVSPLIFLVTLIAGFFYADATQRVASDLGSLIPGNGGDVILTILQQMRSSTHRGFVSTLLGAVVLLFGATAVFGQLQDALNIIWRVPARTRRPLWNTVRQRLLSFTMVLGAAFLLLVSLLVTTALTAVLARLHTRFAGIDVLWQALNVLSSIAIATLIFGLIFKVVPDRRVAWRDVWMGAVLTGGLFFVGQLILARYLARPEQVALFGGFGSLVVLLLWVYYSAQILLFGAEFTHVVALEREGHVEQPVKIA